VSQAVAAVQQGVEILKYILCHFNNFVKGQLRVATKSVVGLPSTKQTIDKGVINSKQLSVVVHLMEFEVQTNSQ